MYVHAYNIDLSNRLMKKIEMIFPRSLKRRQFNIMKNTEIHIATSAVQDNYQEKSFSQTFFHLISPYYDSDIFDIQTIQN